MEPLSLYLTLLLVGSVLIGTEIFVPGGILGIIGSAVWLAAAVVGWRSFPEPWNLVSALALLLMGILTFVVWIRYFPKSRVGKNLSLTEDTADYKAHKPTDDLPPGTAGEALTTLRPSGIATFNGRRIDVVADGEWIEAGEAVKVATNRNGHIAVIKA